jgi:hypothetical protein
MPAADSSYVVRFPADLCFVSAPSEASRYSAQRSDPESLTAVRHKRKAVRPLSFRKDEYKHANPSPGALFCVWEGERVYMYDIYIHAHTHVACVTNTCVGVCDYVCMYVCMYACMHVYYTDRGKCVSVSALLQL